MRPFRSLLRAQRPSRGRVATSRTRPTREQRGHRRRRPARGTSRRPARRRPPGRRRAGTPGARRLRRRWRPAVVRRAGSAAGSRCRRGRRTPPRCRAPPRPPPCARSAARQANPAPRPSTPTMTLTASTAMMMLRWLIRSAAMPPTRTKATRPAPRHVATSDSDVGIVVERDDLQRHHDGPHALGEDRQGHARAISRRYSRNRNGASTRQPPVAHRLLDVELRTHPSMVADRRPSSRTIFGVIR